MSRPLVIAHRGASGQRPENTIPAYDLAVELGSDMIEIDLHHSRDGEIVIAHDARPAYSTLEMMDLTLEEIRSLDAGSGERVPTLDEVLDTFGARISFNLEIKHAEERGRYDGLEAQALAALGARGLLGRTLFSSFYDDVLQALRSHETDARLAVLVSPRYPEGAIERAQGVAAEAVNPHFVLATDEFVAGAHDAGLAVHVYTVDDEIEMRRLVELGVDGIFTNHPDRLIELLAHG